jgi:2-polyprenyl-6-methoxyphenol hydroxylase-like FAD-dependent oxidoreductase
MTALLLARRGVDVTLLEMHKDFDRDFRGDTVHASTLDVLDQIGLAEPLHGLPHAKMRSITLHTPQRAIPLVNFGRLKTRYPYVMIMPQSDFLGFLTARAAAYPNFHLRMGAQVVDVLRDGARTVGVRVMQDGESHDLHAPLTVACDGRFSRMRKILQLEAQAQSPPMDVAWLRLPRRADDGHEEGVFYIGNGHMLVMFARPDAWQVGYVLPKGDFASVKALGMDVFRRSIAELAPWLGDRTSAIEQWHDVHLLSVKSDRLPRWHYRGVLLIGDAAHVMSPVFGVGINYAIADAVELVNAAADALLGGAAPEEALAEVQRRRERPTRIIQRMQAAVQERIVKRALDGKDFDLPLIAKLILATPLLRDIPARIIASGLSPVRLSVV